MNSKKGSSRNVDDPQVGYYGEAPAFQTRLFCPKSQRTVPETPQGRKDVGVNLSCF